MERGNTKHGPRLDEEMEHEVRGILQGGGAGSRVEEWREAEPAGEDQPEVSVVPNGSSRAGAPAGMTPEEVDERSELGRYIPMSTLPGTRDELVAGARTFLAPDHVLATLASLPDDGTRYETVYQVWDALGHANETRRM